MAETVNTDGSLPGNCTGPLALPAATMQATPTLAHLDQFMRNQFGSFAASETEIDDVELAIDALIEGIDQVAEAAARKHLQGMHFGHRRETADSLQLGGGAGDDAGAVRPCDIVSLVQLAVSRLLVKSMPRVIWVSC